MRRVSIKTGLNQRLNDILGFSTTAAKDPITTWSIQAAMLSNLERIIKAIAGDNDGKGRVMKGLELSGLNSLTLSISPGIGFTDNGSVIWLQGGLSKTISPTAGNRYIYLKPEIVDVDASIEGNSEAKKTSFIDGSPQENIVADDKITSLKGNVQPKVDEVLVISTTETHDLGYLYLGSLEVDGTKINNIIKTDKTGFTN